MKQRIIQEMLYYLKSKNEGEETSYAKGKQDQYAELELFLRCLPPSEFQAKEKTYDFIKDVQVEIRRIKLEGKYNSEYADYLQGKTVALSTFKCECVDRFN